MVPACAADFLNHGLLREQYGLSGYVVSDCGAISDFLVNNSCSGCGAVLPTHGLCSDYNWTDTCPSCESKCMAQHMYGGGTDSACGVVGDQIGAVQVGMVTKAQLTMSTHRILRTMLSVGAGLSEEDQPYSKLGESDIDSEATRALNLEAAQQSMVLLQNRPAPSTHPGRTAVADNNDTNTIDIGPLAPVLPLPAGANVAVLGPYSSDSAGMLSNYHPAGPDSTSVNRLRTVSEEMTLLGYNVSQYDASHINLHGNPPDLRAIGHAASLAGAADAAVVLVGLNAGEECESNDRNRSLGLTGDQMQLVQAVVLAQPRTAVVLVHGGPLAIEWIKSNVPAILDAHYPGAQGPAAIASVLSGRFNPCGRLTTSIYPGGFADRSIFETDLRADGGITYSHYDGSYGKLLYEFGEGESYSDMRVSPITTSPSSSSSSTTNLTASTSDVIGAGRAGLPLNVSVTNAAGPAGCFISLGFVSSDHEMAPLNRRLFDYARAASIAPGTTQTLSVRVTAENLALADPDGTLKLLPGAYRITVGGVNFDMELTGEAKVIQDAPRLPLQNQQ